MPAADRKSPLRPPVRTPAANAHVIPVTTRLLGMIPLLRSLTAAAPVRVSRRSVV